jgi:hypothetical protein
MIEKTIWRNLILTLLTTVGAAAQRPELVRIDDNTDWWSVSRFIV